MLWQVAQATGWSVDYILWGVNWETLALMLADAPRYVKVKAEGCGESVKTSGARRGKKKRTAEEILEMFQTRLKE